MSRLQPSTPRPSSRSSRWGARPGVTLNPATPLNTLDEILPYVDQVLVLSVNPGPGGQSYIPTMTEKIARLRQMIQSRETEVDVEVDGEIDVHTAPAAVASRCQCPGGRYRRIPA